MIRYLVLALVFPFGLQSQDIEISGFNDLQIGTSFKKVKKLLKKNNRSMHILYVIHYHFHLNMKLLKTDKKNRVF